MPIAIGIDLGTTNSCVAVYRNRQVEVIQNGHGNRITPSCVAFNDVERLIGESAVHQIALNPKNSILDVKRLIGRKFTDEAFQSDIPLWPFEVARGCDEKPMIKATFMNEQKLFSADEISAMILAHMKRIAEDYLGTEVRDAVVTVPARFNNSQRLATRDAGTVAGLNVIRIINEPTAAAFAYAVDESLRPKNVLIFDVGGGTCDVSVLHIQKNAIEVVATAGDTHLGGGDFDNRLAGYFISEIQTKHNRDLNGNSRAVWRLKSSCEKAKKDLSFSIYANINIVCLDREFDFSATITRAKFEELTLDLLEKLVKQVETCLNDAGMRKTQIDDVVLVGGSTRIPKLRQLLGDFIGANKFVNNDRVHVDEAVAYGAALQAAILSGTKKTKRKLKDVTPLSLGKETIGDVMSVIIPRNTAIPVVRERAYVTNSDNISSMGIYVYEGERTKASDNNFLGEFTLEGIPPAPREVGEVNVCFNVDADGILTVSATEVTTGKTKSMIMGGDVNRFSRKEIEGMISNAERYKEEDKRYKKAMEAKNSLIHCIYDIRKSVQRANLEGMKLKLMEEGIRYVDERLEDGELPEEKYVEMEQILKKLSEWFIGHP